MKLVMDASKNEEFVNSNPELINESKRNDDQSSSFSGGNFKEVYIPPDEKEKLLKMFSTSVVQDFGDDYHLTREERQEIQERYKKFFRLKKGFTKKIRRLDKFVEAYRLCLEIIDDIAETNGVYSPEKFRQKALDGTIIIEGLRFPKFQGKRKKKINWKYVAEYVCDPTKDIRELTEVQELAEEEANIDPTDILPEGELNSYIQALPEDEQLQIDHQAIIGITSSKNAGEMDRKHQRWLAKKCPAFVKNVKDTAKVGADETRRKTHAWDISDEEIEVLREYDSKIRGKNSIEMPEFNGDFLDSKAVDAYLLQLDEYEKENTFISYNGRLISEADYENTQYMQALEEAGWNIRNLYDNREKAKLDKKAEKDDRKRIEALKNMLTIAQQKEDYRSKGYSEKEIRELLKKEAKVGNKNKKKKKKAKKELDTIILDAVKSKDKNFKKYKKRMERM